MLTLAADSGALDSRPRCRRVLSVATACPSRFGRKFQARALYPCQLGALVNSSLGLEKQRRLQDIQPKGTSISIDMNDAESCCDAQTMLQHALK